MKVVFSNYDDVHNPHYGGGGAVAIHEVAKRLVKHYGMTVSVITGSYPGSRNETREGVQYERRGMHLFGPRVGQLIYQALLPCLLLGKHFDVWVESFTPPFSTAFLPLFTEKPVIGLAHLFGGSEMRRKYGLAFDSIERRGIQHYRHCIAVSDMARRKMAELNTDCDIVTIHNGVDYNFFSGGEKKKSHILFIGRVEMDQKGLDLLLDAYVSIKERVALPLVIAGTGSSADIARLTRRIEKLHISDRVRLIGRVSDAVKKRDLFWNAALVVMPSRYETLPLVALEALASGTPLVTFDIDGMKWIPEQIAQKARPFDTGHFGALVEEILQDETEWQRLSSGGTAFARGYDWDKVALHYAQVLRRVGGLPEDQAVETGQKVQSVLE